MLNIDEIQNGIVIDHIKAGTAIGLMDLLGIKGNRTASVALIQNARSHKAESGRKDIIKVEGDASWLNLDVLGYLDEIPVCVAYELNGERVDHFPVTPKLEQCKPIYVKLPGWKCDTRGIKNFDELPENARHYIEFLEKEVGCPFKLISNGPRRDEIIYR